MIHTPYITNHRPSTIHHATHHHITPKNMHKFTTLSPNNTGRTPTVAANQASTGPCRLVYTCVHGYTIFFKDTLPHVCANVFLTRSIANVCRMQVVCIYTLISNCHHIIYACSFAVLMLHDIYQSVNIIYCQTSASSCFIDLHFFVRNAISNRIHANNGNNRTAHT